MGKYLKINCDGGARGNPGPAASSFVVYERRLHGLATDTTDTDRDAWILRYKCGKFLGVKTNNEAEYAAVIEALLYLINSIKSINSINSINLFLDSNLVVNQINGIFKVKEPRLRELLVKVRELEGQIKVPITYFYMPREQNKEADELVNQTLDKN